MEFKEERGSGDVARESAAVGTSCAVREIRGPMGFEETFRDREAGDMIDRVDELLDFDLALLDSLAARRPLPTDEAASASPHRLRGADEPVRFAGFDEAGRGALAGPVSVACVRIDLARWTILPLDREQLTRSLAGLDDSKRLTPRRREALYREIVSVADWGVGWASAIEIDRWGIVGACRVAARRAVVQLSVSPSIGLFDRGLSLVENASDAALPELSFTGGDARSLHIAAASIVAKVERDAILERLATRFSGYGLGRHKGYGTAAHRSAIRRLGPSPVHRRSFCSRIERAESQSC